MLYLEIAGLILWTTVVFIGGAFVGSHNPTQTNAVHKELDAAIAAGVADVHSALTAKIKA